MNGYEFIMMVQNRMKDPVFAQQFNALVAQLKRQKAIEKLPSKAKDIVQQIFNLLNS